MAKNTRYRPGHSGSSGTKFKPGNPYQWTRGVSGNPSGKSRHRAQFEEAFNEALITEGNPQEAAKLLWEAARSKEPWAIQTLCQRFSPARGAAPQRTVAGSDVEACGRQGQRAGRGAIFAARDRWVRGSKPGRRKDFTCCRSQCT